MEGIDTARGASGCRMEKSCSIGAPTPRFCLAGSSAKAHHQSTGKLSLLRKWSFSNDHSPTPCAAHRHQRPQPLGCRAQSRCLRGTFVSVCTGKSQRRIPRRLLLRCHGRRTGYAQILQSSTSTAPLHPSASDFRNGPLGVKAPSDNLGAEVERNRALFLAKFHRLPSINPLLSQLRIAATRLILP